MQNAGCNSSFQKIEKLRKESPTMQKNYARVIIDISHEKVDRPFCYKVPEHWQDVIEVGVCVEVPFGKGNTLRKGYIIELMEQSDFDPALIKEITDVNVPQTEAAVCAEITDDEKIDIAAARILELYRPAFEVLAK